MHQLSEENPRAGYRMITSLLRREGWRTEHGLVNKKRVHRLWKLSGLQVPQKQRKRRRLGTSEHGCVRLKAQYPNHVWSVDFLFDTTEDGRQVKLMPVLDEYTRQCLVIDVSRSITSAHVIEQLKRLFAEHGPPVNLRSDNGPEFIAEALKRFLSEREVQTRYIEPGAPWQNGYVESFNATFRDELLDRELFSTLLEAEVLSEQYRLRYNEHRPHSSLDYQTPSAYAAGIRRRHTPRPSESRLWRYGQRLRSCPHPHSSTTTTRSRPSRTGAGTNIAPGTKNGGTPHLNVVIPRTQHL